jgi:hypothetical protein
MGGEGDEKVLGAGSDPYHHYHTKPEQDGELCTERELHHQLSAGEAAAALAEGRRREGTC